MPEWLILVAVPLALIVGLLANRWLGREARDQTIGEGLGIKEAVGPVTTLAVLLLAFVMVSAMGSYSDARQEIGNEARVVDQLAESASRIEDQATSRELQALLICYARAVRYKEWETMADGDRAPEVGEWTDMIKAELATMRRAGGDAELERLIELDNGRSEARLRRITESNPTIPTGMNWLMFAAVIVAVLGFGFFATPKGSQAVYVTTLTVLAVLLAAALFMIYDLDRPFAGVNKLEPTEMSRIQESLEADLEEQEPGAAVPCSDEGDPRLASLREPGRLQRLSALQEEAHPADLAAAELVVLEQAERDLDVAGLAAQRPAHHREHVIAGILNLDELLAALGERLVELGPGAGQSLVAAEDGLAQRRELGRGLELGVLGEVLGERPVRGFPVAGVDEDAHHVEVALRHGGFSMSGGRLHRAA